MRNRRAAASCNSPMGSGSGCCGMPLGPGGGGLSDSNPVATVDVVVSVPGGGGGAAAAALSVDSDGISIPSIPCLLAKVDISTATLRASVAISAGEGRGTCPAAGMVVPGG